VPAARVPRGATLLALLIPVLLAPAVTPPALHAAVERIVFRTEDGVSLAATWYEPSFRPGPAVILVHMYRRTRRDWEPAARRFAAEGIGALAVDLRGHGDSAGSVFGDGPDPDYASMVADVKAARRYLASRRDVEPGRVGIAGASLGASLAVLAAASDPTIASLALLSPSIDYRGLRIEGPLRKLTRPVFLVASDDDPYASRSARELQKPAGGTRELLLLHQAGHGTTMTARAPEAVRALVDWFRRTLL
jgi:pimeloyl-ACP methyl ester carboxylesterase